MLSRVLGGFFERRAAVEDPTTLEALFRAHAEDVHRIATRMLGPRASQSDVDDIVQKVFLAAHHALPRFRHESKTSTWIYGITTRVVLNDLRSRRRYYEMVERYQEHAPLEAHAPDLEAQIADRAELERVWRCLVKIKPNKRVVFVLHELEGMTAAEIAEALRSSEGTIRSRLRHARQELIVHLDRDRPKEGPR